MAAKRGKRTELSEWSKRLLGVVFCAFFGLGVLVGGRMGVRRTSGWLEDGVRKMRDMVGGLAGQRGDQRPGSFAAASIALVRRGTKFYALAADGGLSGPASLSKEGDLPILSGAGIEGAPGPAMLDYAALIVRTEAALSQTVSELRAAPDGTVKVYLAASPTEVIVDSSKAASELERAAWVMRRWRGREKLIAALDVTPADAAAVRFHSQARAARTRRGQTRAGRVSATEGAGREPPAATGSSARR